MVKTVAIEPLSRHFPGFTVYKNHFGRSACMNQSRRLRFRRRRGEKDDNTTRHVLAASLAVAAISSVTKENLAVVDVPVAVDVVKATTLLFLGSLSLDPQKPP